MMTGRERMLTALANGRPDRLPCQVHCWMDYYLNHFLGGIGQVEAYEKFGMDMALYVAPEWMYDERDMARWQVKRVNHGQDADGNWMWDETITTPKGILHHAGEYNEMTGWETEYVIKNEKDFEIWDEFYPVPGKIDFSGLCRIRDRVGDRGIVRTWPFSPGQGSPWQSFCYNYGTEQAIMLAFDNPQFLHHVLESILQKTLRVAEMYAGIPADLIELGGGAGSNTVISPALHLEFCLPYDQRQVKVFHAAGLKVVYHLCGGIMHLLETVVENGADGLETMTPPSMGGDCDLREASRRVGEKLFFIGGFDQNAGFERGTPAGVRKQVFELFEATRDHAGYIICPSDHFFSGDPANIQVFVDACRECVY